ncbi:MAG: FAD:protein FMN transferase [Acidobacteriota bacterium]
MSDKLGRRHFLNPRSMVRAATVRERAANKPETHLLRLTRRAMACEFEIFIAASQRQKVDRVMQALDEVNALERQMTVFSQDSEISLINRQAHECPVEVEERLFDLLSLGLHLYGETRGAFDMTALPLSRCWGFLARQGKVPSAVEIENALSSVGSQHIQLDRQNRSIFFQHPNLQLNLGAIGKGYALDRAARILDSAGIGNALLHAGHSSLLALGNSSDERSDGWQVSIRHPRSPQESFASLRLHNQGMSTSGSGEQHFLYNDKRYGHLIDPRTGYPAEGNLSTTVLAPTGAEADALSTAFFIMNLDEVHAYCERHPGVSALLVPNQNSEGPLDFHAFGFNSENLEVYSCISN